MSLPLPPTIQLLPGLKIGYAKPLARFEQPATLHGGTHFLLARNGRGKTTLLRTLAGVLRPIAGEFHMSCPVQYLPEDLRFDGELSPAWIFRCLLPKSRLDDALQLAKRIDLDISKPYGRLSTGNRRKAHLIAAEFSIEKNCPTILLLDEPFSGIDAFTRQAFEEIWRESPDHILRLVSCHPDYDAMAMPSTLLIDNGVGTHLESNHLTWQQIREFLN